MEYLHTPPSLSELRRLRKPLRKAVRREFKESFSQLEKFAVFVTRRVGSMGFFFLLSLWSLGWLGWNLFGPVNLRFDPAPAFVLWLFISNILQLVLLPLVMVGQNLEGKFADQRAQADFEVNQKAEYEIEVILAHLENQNQLRMELMQKIDRK